MLSFLSTLVRHTQEGLLRIARPCARSKVFGTRVPADYVRDSLSKVVCEARSRETRPVAGLCRGGSQGIGRSQGGARCLAVDRRAARLLEQFPRLSDQEGSARTIFLGLDLLIALLPFSLSLFLFLSLSSSFFCCFAVTPAAPVDLRTHLRMFVDSLNYRGKTPSMAVEFSHIKRDNLPDVVFGSDASNRRPNNRKRTREEDQQADDEEQAANGEAAHVQDAAELPAAKVARIETGMAFLPNGYARVCSE